MANEEDLVSQITVTGGPQAAAEIQSFADKGSQAFDKLNKSAAASSAGVAASAEAAAAGAQKAGTGLQKLGNTPIGSNLVNNIKGIEAALASVTSKLPQLTQAVGRFAQRFALVGTAAAGGAIALASAARNIAKSVDGESNAFEKLTQQQIDTNNSQLSGQVAAINHASAIRQLNAQLAAGKITYSQYNDAVKQSNADFQEQQRVAVEVENETNRVKEANDRLTKSLADRTAMNKLIDTFGGPLTSSLISFGRQVEVVRKDFISAFSPALAAGIDLLSNVISKNATTIGKFFDTAGQKLQTFITNNGPGLTKLFETLGAAGAAVFNGLLDAAPGVIDFFNNQLAPAINKVIGFFGLLADAINAVFGTKLTGGSIILIAILAQMTGSIRLLFTLLRTGSAIFKGFIGLLGQVGVAIAEAFGAKNAANVVKLATTIGKGGGPIKAFLAIFRSAIPIIVAAGEALALALGIGFAPAILIIGALTAAFIFLLKNVNWGDFLKNAQTAIQGVIKFFSDLVTEVIRIFTRIIQGVIIINNAATQGVIDAWNAVVTFFTDTLPTAVTSAFTTLWTGITAAASAVAQGVVDAWNAVVAFFTNLPATLTAIFTTIWTFITTGFTNAVTFVTTTFNTLIAFLQSIPGTLQSIWDTVSSAITNAFQTAVSAVTGFFSDMVTRVTSILQPIISLLQTIISLGASAASAADGAGGGPGFASGGRIRGPGGPRDDRVPILASNGEFMMQARAVAKYGSAFMHAVNSGRFDLGRFAGGGMIIPAPVHRARFADGGPIGSSGRPLSLTIGGETFSGLIAPDDVADRLSKFATIRQVRSAGRKPSWVGRGK